MNHGQQLSPNTSIDKVNTQRSNKAQNKDLGMIGPFGPTESPAFRIPYTDVKQSQNTNFLPDL